MLLVYGLVRLAAAKSCGTAQKVHGHTMLGVTFQTANLFMSGEKETPEDDIKATAWPGS